MVIATYLAALLVITFVVAFVVVCVRDKGGTQKLPHPVVGAAISAEQQQQAGQTADVDQKRTESNDPFARPWWIAVLVAGIGFIALMIYGYVNGWSSGAWTALFSLALVFCTVGQAWIAHWQRDVMSKQMALAEKSINQQRDLSEIELRAYVGGVAQLAITPAVGTPGKQYLVTVLCKNGGKTPAYDVEIVSNFAFRDHSFNGSLPLLTGIARKSVMLLGPDSPPVGQTVGEVLDIAQCAKLAAHQAIVFVHGRIQFRDVFGVIEVVDFCYTIGGDGRDDELLIAPTGNQSTKHNRERKQP